MIRQQQKSNDDVVAEIVVETAHMEEAIQTTPVHIEEQLNELIPLNIIRTETVLSKLPIHNLAKKGSVNIHIVKKDSQGKVHLLWKVSPSRDYGEPRQLAYKLDTIVINRRLDEQGRPLPKVIRLGSLRELAQDLQLGSDTASVRKALLQNASAFITAKLTYKANDGRTRRLETGFARYSVVFTGEELPDGSKADAVHLLLNDPYHEVLNNAPMRPLDYDYLRKLPPAAQRFYEILSRRFFAAMKFKHPAATLAYSEYCTYSAQRRYFDRQPMQNQMSAIHREHKKFGYITSVSYTATVDSENKPDWILSYMPGPKARAEYLTFTRKQRIEASAKAIETTAETEKKETPAALQLPATQEATDAKLTPFLAELGKRGVAEKHARKLLASLAEGQQVMDQLEYGDLLISQNPRSFRNPPGFYISLIKDNVIPPPSFENSRRRQLREEREQARQKWLFEEQQLRNDYELYRDQQKERYIREHLSQEEYQQLFSAAKQQYKREWPRLSDETLTEMAHGKVRGEIEPCVEFLSFEAWRKHHQQAAPLPGSQTGGETPS